MSITTILRSHVQAYLGLSTLSGWAFGAPGLTTTFSLGSLQSEHESLGLRDKRGLIGVGGHVSDFGGVSAREMLEDESSEDAGAECSKRCIVRRVAELDCCHLADLVDLLILASMLQVFDRAKG